MRAPKRVLLVEDLDDSRHSLSQLLEIEGYEVIQAVDGRQAIDLAIQHSPDLILMDLSLPVVDGLAATRQMREHPSLREVPIIAVSGHDPADIEPQARAAGCTAFIGKPIEFDALVSLLSEHLSRQ